MVCALPNYGRRICASLLSLLVRTYFSANLLVIHHVAFVCLDAGGRGDKGTQARGFLQTYLKVSCDFGPVPGDDGQSLTFVPFLNAKLFFDEYEMR